MSFEKIAGYLVLSCRPEDDHFRCNKDLYHNRQPSTQYSPLAIFQGWDIRMDSYPGAGEYDRQAAPNYVPYRPGSKYIGVVGEK